MVNTHNFFSMYRLIRKRVKRIGMDIEAVSYTHLDVYKRQLFAAFISLVQVDRSDKCLESIPVHIAVVGRRTG